MPARIEGGCGVMQRLYAGGRIVEWVAAGEFRDPHGSLPFQGFVGVYE